MAIHVGFPSKLSSKTESISSQAASSRKSKDDIQEPYRARYAEVSHIVRNALCDAWLFPSDEFLQVSIPAKTINVMVSTLEAPTGRIF